MKLFLKYLAMHFKSQMEYRISFLFMVTAQFLVLFTMYFSIIALFQKFQNIKGFTLFEVLLCFSTVLTGYSFAEGLVRGFDQFDGLIVRGDFDRLLVRPKSIYIQVLGSAFAFDRLGRVVQSITILCISVYNIKISLISFKMLVVLLMVLGSFCVFAGIFILSASFCFLTVQGLEVRNILTDGAREMASYPMGIYKKGFFYFFTFVVPISCINYFPLLYVLGKSTSTYYGVLPLMGIIFLAASLVVFNKGIKRYQGTGS